VDLFNAGQYSNIVEAHRQLSKKRSARSKMSEWADVHDAIDGDDATRYLSYIERLGKGRFAQRLASVIAKSGEKACPEYVLKGVRHVAAKCE
jgi:putative ATP-dependent endonuclease of OLD family